MMSESGFLPEMDDFGGTPKRMTLVWKHQCTLMFFRNNPKDAVEESHNPIQGFPLCCPFILWHVTDSLLRQHLSNGSCSSSTPIYCIYIHIYTYIANSKAGS